MSRNYRCYMYDYWHDILSHFSMPCTWPSELKKHNIGLKNTKMQHLQLKKTTQDSSQSTRRGKLIHFYCDMQQVHVDEHCSFFKNRGCTVRGWMATQYHSIHLELNMFNNTRHATQRWLPTPQQPQCFAVYNIRIHEVLIQEHYRGGSLITCTCKSAVCFPVVTMYLIILLYILVLSNFLFFYLTEEPDETGTRDVRL